MNAFASFGRPAPENPDERVDPEDMVPMPTGVEVPVAGTVRLEVDLVLGPQVLEVVYQQLSEVARAAMLAGFQQAAEEFFPAGD